MWNVLMKVGFILSLLISTFGAITYNVVSFHPLIHLIAEDEA